MPYIAKYSANNGPIQYIDSSNSINFVGYSTSAANLTSAMYIRSTVNLGDDFIKPGSSYFAGGYKKSYGCVFFTLGKKVSGLNVDNTILSSVDTFNEYIDALWYEDSGTDFEKTSTGYKLTKFNKEIPSALARGYVNTADCARCNVSSYYAVTANLTTTGKVGIICTPPASARAGYFVCVQKRDFDKTNFEIYSDIRPSATISALYPYNRLLAYKNTYKCDSATDFTSYSRIVCDYYNTVQNVQIDYANVPSSVGTRGFVSELQVSPVYYKRNSGSDYPVLTSSAPTVSLKNIDLITNSQQLASAYSWSANVGKLNTYGGMPCSTAIFAVYDNVTINLTNLDAEHENIVINASNINYDKAFYNVRIAKVLNNCTNQNAIEQFGIRFVRLDKDCLVLNSVITDGTQYGVVDCTVNYKLLNSSAVLSNMRNAYVDVITNNFANDIVNSNITATLSNEHHAVNIVKLNFSAAYYKNVNVTLSANAYNPESFEVTLPASAQSAFTISANAPYTIYTY